MTKLFAASAYVAVMSLAIAGEGHSQSPHRAAQNSPRSSGPLEKSDCGAACARPAARSGGAASFASLERTGPSETTAVRAATR